jgi:hypothetical protein
VRVTWGVMLTETSTDGCWISDAVGSTVATESFRKLSSFVFFFLS